MAVPPTHPPNPKTRPPNTPNTTKRAPTCECCHTAPSTRPAGAQSWCHGGCRRPSAPTPRPGGEDASGAHWGRNECITHANKTCTKRARATDVQNPNPTQTPSIHPSINPSTAATTIPSTNTQCTPIPRPTSMAAQCNLHRTCTGPAAASCTCRYSTAPSSPLSSVAVTPGPGAAAWPVATNMMLGLVYLKVRERSPRTCGVDTRVCVCGVCLCVCVCVWCVCVC